MRKIILKRIHSSDLLKVNKNHVMVGILNRTDTGSKVIKSNVQRTFPVFNSERKKKLEKMEFDLKSINWKFFSRITFIYFLHSLKIRKRFSDVR